MKSLSRLIVVMATLICFTMGIPRICVALNGDVTGDGAVNVFDALLVLQYSVGLIDPRNVIAFKAAADVAPLDAFGKPLGDGQVNVFDALAILRHAVGLDSWISTHLKDFGPLNAAGFPVWYRDNNNLPVLQCLASIPSPTGLGGMCSTTMVANPNQAPSFDPTQPVIFNSNWPSEAFYFQAENDQNFAILSSKKTRIVLALLSSFVNVNPAQGDQIVFSRVRITLKGVPLGNYTITHPYGVETMTVTIDPKSEVLTRDIPIVPTPGVFTDALAGVVGPFLKWTPDPNYAGIGTNPDGTITVGGETFLGDPNVPHTITGSPLNQNYIRINGPAGSNIGGAGIDSIQTTLFLLESRINTNLK